MDPELILAFSAKGAIHLLGVALVFTLIRLVRGPTLPDRVIALDLVATTVVGITVVDAILTHEYQFLRAAIALALVSFLGTVAFAMYLQKGRRS
jgi:multicomponent Na+:H+ antiporter subunit F